MRPASRNLLSALVLTGAIPALVLLAGCIENQVKPGTNAPGLVAADTGSVVDSGESGGDTGADTAISACAGPPPDTTMPVAITCPTPFDASIEVRWSVPLAVYGATVRAAPTEGRAMDIWVEDGVDRVGVYDADGSLIATQLLGSNFIFGTLGDIDSTRPGSEYLASYGDIERLGPEHVGLVDPSSTLWSVTAGDGTINEPWLADLYGDGQVEALIGKSVFDARTGELLAELAGIDALDESASIAVDLDADGTDEIVAADNDAPVYVSYFAPDGSLRATCYTAPGDSEHVAFAVGDVDGDPGGEVVAAGSGFTVICDSDGALLAASDLGVDQPALVGIGELDGDAGPEVAVSGSSGLVVANADLSIKWSYGVHSGDWSGSAWYPFSLADLNGDGAQEVIVHDQNSLVVLDGGSGAVLASVALPDGDDWGSAWHGQPIVVDVDGDGTAEILVGDIDLVCLEDGSGAGWVVDGSDRPWPGRDHFPGDRMSDGAIPSPGAPWKTPGENVWQGLPAYGVVARAELGVSITDVCVESCDGDAVVTVEVFNSGQVAIPPGTMLKLTALQSGELLAAASTSDLPSGFAMFVSFTVPAAKVQGGVEANVSAPDGVEECGNVPNEVAWQDASCP